MYIELFFEKYMKNLAHKKGLLKKRWEEPKVFEKFIDYKFFEAFIDKSHSNDSYN